MRLVLRHGVWMLIVGETVGLAGAIALNKLIESMVFGVRTTDPLTYAVTSSVWAVTALLALQQDQHARRPRLIRLLLCAASNEEFSHALATAMGAIAVKEESIEKEMDEEFRFHLESLIQENIRAG